MADRVTHNIVTFETDDRIVEAVKARTGNRDYSAAVRFIIREFGRLTGLETALIERMPVKPRTRARIKSRRVKQPSEIAGVRKGV